MLISFQLLLEYKMRSILVRIEAVPSTGMRCGSMACTCPISLLGIVPSMQLAQTDDLERINKVVSKTSGLDQ